MADDNGSDEVDRLDRPLRGASIGEAYTRFWKKYATFEGRASRSEFWWAVLVNGVISAALDGPRNGVLGDLGYAFGVVTLVPSLAIGARRLHDVNRSGWSQLLVIIPIVGWIILIIWWASEPDKEGVRFDVS